MDGGGQKVNGRRKAKKRTGSRGAKLLVVAQRKAAIRRGLDFNLDTPMITDQQLAMVIVRLGEYIEAELTDEGARGVMMLAREAKERGARAICELWPKAEVLYR